MFHFKNVTIIGVGLIGGSLARVLKAKKLADEITGAGRGRETLERARELGVIDRIVPGPAQAVKDADLVVLAPPVGAFERIAQVIGPKMKHGAILTDVGSVKGKLVTLIEGLLPAGVHYVPGHPIAGKETSGVSEASATLFKGAKCILTPTHKTDGDALAAVKTLWQLAGAHVLEMEPDIHDRVFAAVSHLPHVAAYAMVCAVAELKTDSEDYITFSGGGFRDFTRIAAGSPEMWRDICLMNQKNVLEMIDRYQFSLNMIKRAIRAEDTGKIEKLFRSASDVRKGLS